MTAAKVAAHGAVGGLSAQAAGGNFESGFWSAGLSQAAGQYGAYDKLGAVENAQGWNIAYNAGVSAVVGGSISEVTGGSFEQGAISASMGRLFNDLQHLAKKSYYMWIEGPSKVNMIPFASLTQGNENVEPPLHISLSLYNGEAGLYTSYSFALDPSAFGISSEFPFVSSGQVYKDDKLYGPVIPGTLRELSRENYLEIYNSLTDQVGTKGVYSPVLGDTCISWTVRKYSGFMEKGTPASGGFDPRRSK